MQCTGLSYVQILPNTLVRKVDGRKVFNSTYIVSEIQIILKLAIDQIVNNFLLKKVRKSFFPYYRELNDIADSLAK